LEQSAVVLQLGQSVTVVRRRVRITQGLRAAARVVPWLLIPLSLAAGFVVLGWLPRWGLWGALALAVVLLGAYGWAAARHVSRMAVALTIDRHLRCEGRFAAAYEFSHASKEDGYQQLVVNEAKTLFPLQLKDVARVSTPAEMWWGGCTVALLVGVSFLSYAPPSVSPSAARGSVAPPRARALGPDDAELLERRAAELKSQVKSVPGTRLAKEYNDLVLRLSDGSLSQAEGFRLAAALSEQVSDQGKQAEELAQGLVKRGELLRQKRATQGVGQALTDRRFADAAQALEKLAQRLSEGTEGLSARELDDLRKSLEQLREEQEEQLAQQDAQEASSEDKARSELERKQAELEAKRDQGKASADELKQLSETERALKRLSRQQKQPQRDAAQQLSELDRKLSEAARALQEERKKSGEFLQQAARQIAEQGARSLSDEEKRALIEQLEALKERLREQNESGARQQQLRDFQRRARGKSSPAEDGPSAEPHSGDGRPGAQTPFDVRLGPGSADLPSPERSSEQMQGADREESTRGQGMHAGHAHDPHLTGDASRLAHQNYQDKAAAGQDSGAGPSASETIASAAERGFTASSYQKLYHEYQTVAEEIMDKDRVPSGRQTHVRRYVDLIRPRDDTSDSQIKQDE
jgi:hypothetical protein